MKVCKQQNDIKWEFVLPLRVIISEKTKNEEILFEEHDRQAFLGNLPVCSIKKGGFAVFDFGEEMCGGADLVVQIVEGCAEGVQRKIRVTFGETVGEAMSDIGAENSTNDHSPRDFYIESSFFSHHQIGNTGFRFIKIEAVEADIEIASLQGIAKYRPLEYKGSFSCSDDMLNRIWKIGAKTVHLCMQEFLWDGIKRDRLVWIGDCHPETSTISMVFGETDVVKKSLNFVRDWTPMPKFMNNLPSYSMWWLKIQRDLYWDCGNLEYLKEQKDYVVDLLNNVINSVKGNKTSFTNFFVDHSSNGTPDAEPGFYSMLIIGLLAGVDILQALDTEKELIAKCKETVNNLQNNQWPDIKNKNTAALTALSGIHSLKDICENVIMPNGAEGISAFLGYYALIALHKYGKTDIALDYIKKFWGGMVEMGATSFWEEFKFDWIKDSVKADEPITEGKHGIKGDLTCYNGYRLSLCHGWASGPTTFLSRYVLGVEPVLPGYKKIKVVPHLGDLDYACGDIPTPYGNIHIFHKKVNGEIKTEITLPIGVDLEK